MKGIHWSLWVALAALIVIIVILTSRKERYAPPRDENTNPPYTEDVSNTVNTSNNSPYVEPTSNLIVDNQTQIYKDMGGMDYQLEAGNPILNFIQGDPSSNVIYGDFVPNESDGGSAHMYAIQEEQEETSNLLPIPENPKLTDVQGVDVNGVVFGGGTAFPSDSGTPTVSSLGETSVSGQYLPELTSRTIPFLGEVLGETNVSESPVSTTSPEVNQ
jgi:hypothetical protein